MRHVIFKHGKRTDFLLDCPPKRGLKIVSEVTGRKPGLRQAKRALRDWIVKSGAFTFSFSEESPFLENAARRAAHGLVAIPDDTYLYYVLFMNQDAEEFRSLLAHLRHPSYVKNTLRQDGRRDVVDKYFK